MALQTSKSARFKLLSAPEVSQMQAIWLDLEARDPRTHMPKKQVQVLTMREYA